MNQNIESTPNTTSEATQSKTQTQDGQIAPLLQQLLKQGLSPAQIEREVNQFRTSGATEYTEVRQLAGMGCTWPEIHQALDHLNSQSRERKTAAA